MVAEDFRREAGVPWRTVTARRAACSCEQLHAVAEGEPVRISMCHCLACQRRTGSAFSIQARFPAERVRIEGRSAEYVRISDSGDARTFHFCPECGATVYYRLSTVPDVIAIPIGTFADPTFPSPTISVYESRRHPWLTVTAEVEHHD
jgi:hypothetical protein